MRERNGLMLCSNPDGVPGLRAHPTTHVLPLRGSATDDARLIGAAHALGIAPQPERPGPAPTPHASIAVLPHSFGGSRIELVVQPRAREQGSTASAQGGSTRAPDAHETARPQAYVVCVEYAVPIKADSSTGQGVMVRRAWAACSTKLIQDRGGHRHSFPCRNACRIASSPSCPSPAPP